MQDRQARKKFAQIKQYVQNQQQHSQNWLKSQENLQEQFTKLNDIINDYATKKQQNQKQFQQQMQKHLQLVFDYANNSMQNVNEMIVERNYNWERVSNKMNIFMMLRQNIKQIYSINQKYQQRRNSQKEEQN